jgi:uncharacterized protein YqhQ
MALKNGMVLEGERFRVTAKRLASGTIETVIKEKLITGGSIIKLLERIPFIRGLISFLEFAFMYKAAAIFLLLILYHDFISTVLIYQLLHQAPPPEDSLLEIVFLMADVLSLAIIVIVGKIMYDHWNLKSIGRYHAAKHMVMNTIDNEQILELENVRKASRVTKHCSINFLIVLGLVGVVFKMLYPYFSFSALLLFSWPIAFETLRFQNIKLLAPIFWASGLAQKYVLTLEPTDDELEVAIEVAKALEAKELIK